MPSIATDDFNRADSPVLGANWTLPFSNAVAFRIVSNQCKLLDNGTIGIFWNANSFNNDQYAKIKTVVFSDAFNTGFGAAVRCSGTAGNSDFCGYTFYSDGNDWKLQRQDNGVATNLATGTQSVSVNDIIEIRAVGTTITGYINGSAVSGATATDATYASGQAGMVCADTYVIDPICDDWEGGNVTVDVSVNLTGVAATPAVGIGTVVIEGEVITPPVEDLVPGRMWYGLPEDAKVYLTGVSANPRVGEIAAMARGTQEELEKMFPFPKRVVKRPLPVARKKAPKPSAFVYLAGVHPVPRIGNVTTKAFYEDSDEELSSILKMMDVDEELISALKLAK